MKKIILMPLYGIGDALMSTPAIRNLKESTGAHITFLHMFRTTHDVATGNPNVDENIHFPFLSSSRMSGVRFLLALRGRFDASINFYPSNRRDYNISSFVVGAPIRIGHRYKECGGPASLWFLNNRTIMEDDTLHNVQEDLRLLKFLGIESPEPYPMEIFLTGQERADAADWLAERSIEGGPIIGMHAGSSVFKDHAHKRWPEEKFTSFMKRFRQANPDAVFLMFGGQEELLLKKQIIEASGLPRGAAHTVETAGIRATAAIMQRCGAMLTNDSGLMHLAAALQVPTAAIFGPTNPRWLYPWKCSHMVLRHEVCEGPCFRYSPIHVSCDGGRDFGCIRDVSVDEALEAVSGLLAGASGG